MRRCACNHINGFAGDADALCRCRMNQARHCASVLAHRSGSSSQSWWTGQVEWRRRRCRRCHRRFLQLHRLGELCMHA